MLLTLPLLSTIAPKLLKQYLDTHLAIMVLLVASDSSECVTMSILSHGFQNITNRTVLSALNYDRQGMLAKDFILINLF